jgi:ferric-dicitrate binding protein FerR (iron transport regulator)
MDMDCKGTADLTTKVLSGNGSSQDEAQLRSHVASCAACAAAERRLRKTWELMGQLAPVTSSAPVPALPRVGFFTNRRKLVAAAAAVLVVGATAFALFRPPTPAGPKTPLAVQTSPEESRPDQGEEENRLLDRVLTKIEIEKTPEQAAPQNPPTPEATEPKPVVEKTTTPEPKPTPVPPVQEPKETVKAPIPTTRPEDKTPTPPAPTPVVQPALPVLPVIAVLDHVEGDVVAMLAGKKGPANAGAKLASGDWVETTSKTGQAVVEFSDGSRLVLGAETLVEVGMADGKRVSLKHGALAAQVARQPAGEPMIFLTPLADARVLGTRLSLSVNAASTRLEVREGKVKVTRRDDNNSVEIGAGQFVQVSKGSSLTPKPLTTVRVALHETFDRPRWGGAWMQGGEANLGLRMAGENGSLSFKTSQKPQADNVSGGKMPTDAGEIARKAVQNASALSTQTKKEWPRMAWLETRQAFPFSNEMPLKIRTRCWNSHNDPDRVTWFAINRGLAGQGLAVERRGGSLQLWVEGAKDPVWKKDVATAQEWETLELWISKDQMVVRLNEETLYTGANPLKVKAGALALGVNAKMELAQDEEVRFDDFDVLLTTKAELDEVAR